IFEVKDGRLRIFAGNYIDYCRALASMGEESPLVSRTSGGGDGGGDSKPSQSRRAGKESSSGSAADASSASPLSRDEKKEIERRRHKIEKEIAEIESEIGQIETRIKAIDHELILPSVYSNPQRAGQLAAEQRESRGKLEKATAKWEKLT